MPPPRHRNPALSRGDYLATDGTAQVTDQMAGARRVLIEVVCDVLPEFVQTLRADVYPAFAQVVAPGFWEPGWHFRTWDTVRDANRANRLTFRPVLLRWATRFGAHDESWLLEGALTTLSRWHRVPALRESLDITSLYPPRAGGSQISEKTFTFNDAPGWHPQFEKWTSYRRRLETGFRGALRAYKDRTQARFERLGARPARRTYSVNDVRWFALYQLGGLSSVEIMRTRGGAGGDESTVLKGVKTARTLLGWQTPVRRGGTRARRSAPRQSGN